jgi:hypothetical protein
MSEHPILKRLGETSPREWLFQLRRRIWSYRPLEAFDDAHPFVLVLSTGRVGTRTLAALLALARNVLAFHEPLPRLYGLSQLARGGWDNEAAQPILMEAFRVARGEALERALLLGRGYVETSPHGTFLAPAVARVIPEARFIHLVRDPGSVIRSGMRRGWFAGNPYDSTRITPRHTRATNIDWAGASQFQKIAWLWTETNRWILEFTASLPAHRRTRIRAEEIFNGDPVAIKAAFDMVSSQVPPRAAIERILRKKLNAQKSGEFPPQADWSDEMIEQIRGLAAETASLLGYDL